MVTVGGVWSVLVEDGLSMGLGAVATVLSVDSLPLAVLRSVFLVDGSIVLIELLGLSLAKAHSLLKNSRASLMTANLVVDGILRCDMISNSNKSCMVG